MIGKKTKTNLPGAATVAPGQAVPSSAPLDSIRGAEYKFIQTAWKGTPVVVEVRVLSQVQLEACGHFSVIDVGGGRPRQASWKRWADNARLQDEIVRAALVTPTYADIMMIAGRGDLMKRAEAKFKEINDLIGQLQRGPRRQELERERDMVHALFDLILPSDFSVPIVEFETAPTWSDIHKISGERGEMMLLEAAVKAEKGHDNPVDHLAGAYTEHNRDDINEAAWRVLKDYREKAQREAKGGSHGRR